MRTVKRMKHVGRAVLGTVVAIPASVCRQVPTVQGSGVRHPRKCRRFWGSVWCRGQSRSWYLSSLFKPQFANAISGTSLSDDSGEDLEERVTVRGERGRGERGRGGESERKTEKNKKQKNNLSVRLPTLLERNFAPDSRTLHVRFRCYLGSTSAGQFFVRSGGRVVCTRHPMKPYILNPKP